MNKLFRIDSGYAVFGIVCGPDGKIIEVAPIAYWAMGKDIDYVLSYFKRKKAKIIELKCSL